MSKEKCYFRSLEMEHKMSCKRAYYDWQQKGYKEELVHAFLTVRLTGLQLGAFHTLEVLKPKANFLIKDTLRKKIKVIQKLPRKIVCM